MNILLTTRRERAEQRNPIAILDLAAYARNLGHTVDCYYLDQIVAGRSNGKPYDLVGLSVLQVVKEKQPLRDALYLKKRFGRQVVVGGKWTQTITDEQKSYLEGKGVAVHIGPGEKYFADAEIDYSRYPSWDRIDFETLADVRAEIMSTRGCPYNCQFCHNTEKKISFFSATRTASNIELLFGLGVKRLCFCDDIFTLRPSHMLALYDELKKRSLPIEDRAEFFAHVNHINPEMIALIKRYRPFRINVGVESGDDAMLKLMGKGFNSETAFRKLKMLHDETGLIVGTLFMIGFPGETEESMHRTLDFIRRIRPFAGTWVSYYQPVRGTKGYEMALERNKRMRIGCRNMLISYVDPNLTRKTLFKYNYRMMDYSGIKHWRGKLTYWLIDILPCWLLERARAFRQRKRLRQHTDSYLSETQ
ncbi:MAG TPA: radical SAM protein [Syntrophorhabdales bacterium]|nr:radical SAM protein [Syntrophorhabdales bacterium]